MRDQLLPQAARRRIKQAARELIAAVGGASEAARISGFSIGLVSKFQGDEHPEMMPADLIAFLEIRAGEAIVSRALAEMAGCGVARAEDAEAAQLERLTLAAMKQGAAAVAVAAEAAEDGRVSPNEARVVSLASRKARDSFDRLHRAATAQLAPEGGR